MNLETGKGDPSQTRLDRPRRITSAQAEQRFAARPIDAKVREGSESDRVAALAQAKENIRRIQAELAAGGLDDFEEPVTEEVAREVSANDMVRGKLYTFDGITAKFVRREGEHQDLVFLDDNGQEIVRSKVELEESKAIAA